MTRKSNKTNSLEINKPKPVRARVVRDKVTHRKLHIPKPRTDESKN